MTILPTDDLELIERLKEIDESDDIEVTSWEAEFLESMVYGGVARMSTKQRAVARRMIDQYLK